MKTVNCWILGTNSDLNDGKTDKKLNYTVVKAHYYLSTINLKFNIELSCSIDFVLGHYELIVCFT